MKNLIIYKGIILFSLAIAITFNVFAEENDSSNIKEIEIKTTAQCGMCKERIEKAVNKLSGVENAVLDVESKVLTVNYIPEEVKPDDIRKAVSRVGYDADDVKANKRAYRKLPKCCKIDGHKK